MKYQWPHKDWCKVLFNGISLEVFLILTLCSGCLTKNAEVNMLGCSDFNFNTHVLMWNSDKY